MGCQPKKGCLSDLEIGAISYSGTGVYPARKRRCFPKAGRLGQVPHPNPQIPRLSLLGAPRRCKLKRWWWVVGSSPYLLCSSSRTPSVCPSACPSVRLSVGLSVFLSLRLSVPGLTPWQPRKVPLSTSLCALDPSTRARAGRASEGRAGKGVRGPGVPGVGWPGWRVRG